jgi:hypothetical protein
MAFWLATVRWRENVYLQLDSQIWRKMEVPRLGPTARSLSGSREKAFGDQAEAGPGRESSRRHAAMP